MSNRNITACLLTIYLIIVNALMAQGGAIIKEGDLWRFFKGRTSAPPDQNGQWTQIGYNDAIGWGAPSPTGFGYGDEDDATIFTNMAGDHLSLYIRRPFVIASTTAVTHLTLAADYDDGFVAYLNGQEVARRNMPGGAVNYNTAALGNHEASRAGQDNYTCNCDPQEKEFITLDPGLLVNGTNILAVSGHNSSLDSTDFSLMVELYTNVTLLRGPLLQMPNPGRVTVRWRTDAATDGRVEYGYDATYAAGTVTQAALVRDHEIELPAFPPGTTVHYRIRSSGVTLATNYFRSPKVPGQAMRIAIMADYGSPTTNTLAVAQQALLADPDLLLTAGDNVQQQSGPPGLYDQHWFGPLAGLTARMPMMAALGNHDIRIGQGAGYLQALSLPTNGPPGLEERNYSFDYGNAHFVVLDANAFVPDSSTAYTNAAAQRPLIVSWLTNDLHSTTQLWKFAIYHHPPYTSEGDHGEYDLMKTLISPVLERYGVQVAFQGHNHMYERINPINGVYYFTVGSGGFSIHGLYNQREFSARVFNDRYDFMTLDIDGPHLLLRCVDQNGVEQDRYDLDASHPFRLDGRLDSNQWVRAANGLNLHAAIRGYTLYLATQDAGEGSDHFIYVNTNTAPMRSANWAKGGQVMQWAAYLADENGGSGALAGFYGWFDAAGQVLTNPLVVRSVTSGLNNNGTNGNGVLEGTLNLLTYFGTFPTQLLLAAAPYGSADGGTNYATAQVPMGNGNGDIEPAEFLVLNPRALALDLPQVQIGTTTLTEVGWPMTLNGEGSYSPAGLPLSYTWQQVDGPAGWIMSNGVPLTMLVITQHIAAPTTALVRLTVHDTRFDTQGVITVSLKPLLDTDADGLSDLEEQTGLDNLLTGPNPGGHTSLVHLADSDGDGQDDGQEALAGTNPGQTGSFFEVASGQHQPGGTFLQWSSVAGRVYGIYQSTNLLEAPAPLATNLPAVPPLNSYTVPLDNAGSVYYFLNVRP